MPIAILSAALLSAAAVDAPPNTPNGNVEWENTSVNSINREPPRTYTAPLASEKEALSDALVHKTPYVVSLNGRWKLSWAGNPSLRVKGFERPDFPDADWFGVDVPGCVELQGFGSPGYVNSRYPHKLDWPRILDCQTGKPDYNPVSSYRRRFTVPKEWKGREVFLRFDGVYSAYYVWVNGKMAGYAEDSCLPSEFNVTGLLNDGENVLAVEVYRWCDGSYLEDQDMTRYSGIYRDVSLWSMPKGGIWDFTVKTRPLDGYENWSLELELENGGSASLYEADGKKVGDLTPLSNSNSLLKLQLKPRLWSAEKPYLYTLVVRKGGDIRSKKVGFKDVRIVGNAILVNGRKVKFRGVNRHETSPEGGRTVTLGEMVADIELLKRHNFDTVRTSHYPDHHLWYDLCDRYGIYLCAEANVEGHGAGFAEKGLGRFPEWRDSIVERNVRHVAFYRNHPSVTLWSLGNETGHGPCFTDAIAKVKEMDPSRPVHWERGNPDADVDSHMYRSVEWLEKRGQLGDMPRGSATEKGWPDENYMSSGKPFFMCEYAHAMGNAVGNFAEYWDVFWKYDSLAGGCVWDWADQAVWKYTGRVDENGSRERFLAYGGDWDEQPNDGPFNCNGLVGPERRISAKLLEAAHVQRSLIVRDDLSLENRYGFTWSDEFDGEWSLVEDGVETKKGTFDVPRVAPLSKGRIDLALPAPTKGRETFANISFRLRNDTPWAKKGWCVSRNQIRLSGAVPQAAAKAASPRITECADSVTAEHAGTRAVFSRRTGTLRELVVGGVTVLRDPAPGVAAGPRLTCSRAFVDNDIWVRGYTVDEPRCFMLSGLTQLSYHARPIVVADGKVRLSVEVSGSKSAGFRHDSEWSFLDDGSLTVSNTVIPHGTMPRRLPRLGLSMRLDKSLERVRWYGRGPQENYVDRRTGAFFGVYESTVTDLYEHYTRPQDNGYRSDVRWVDFLSDDGRGVRFSASEPLFVQALHYSEEDLDASRHRKGEPRRMAPLVPSAETYLNLDIRQLGLGGASCGPTTMSKYTFPAQEERWTLRIEPARRPTKAEPPPAPRSAYDDLVPIPRGVRYAVGEVGAEALDRVEVRTASIAGAPAHVADEAYRLTVGVGGVVVEARGEKGVRHARITLAQLRALAGGRPVPAAVVTDWPELKWRGFMPDTARNYLDVPSLKAVIDMMGRYKLNLLHWHLTENYAWRLESRRYPQMQSDDAFVLRHRGKFYTQEEFRDVVDYAYERGVTVMPEFDVPGHAQALRLALGVDRMTAPGVAETVAGLFDELCSLVPAEKMPFIHVGGDEVWTRETEGVTPETLKLWAETIARNGRTLVSWNPGEKYPVAGPRIDMMWGGYGVKSSGAPIFDANGMYIEAMDPFEIICSAAFRRVNPWDVPAEQRLGAIFCAWHDGFTGLPYDNMLRNQQIMPACVLYGNAYWSGCLADRPDRTCRMPQPDDPDFARVVDLERRVVAQRDRVLAGFGHPFHFLRQSDLRWRLSDGDGKLIARDVPGATISPFKGRGSKCNFITNTTGVVVMETWVRSPRDQEVGAWIGFTNIDRDHGLIRASPLPKLGEWTRFGSTIEINGIPVPPPEWNRPGLTRGRNLREVLKSWPWTLWELDEEPFTDQEYFMRPPTRIRLRKGWNHVKLTLPMTSPVTGWSSHQWVGTFIPVLGDSDHPREVPDLEYASEL